MAIPVIPVNTPGFIGDKNIGNRLAGEILLDHVIGTAEPARTTPYDVNLIGEYNIAGDLWGMLPLFERLGIRILSCISGDARFEDLRCAHRARLNVIICSKSLTNLARKMRKRYGIPYLEESFYGMTDTAKALRDMARELDLANGGEGDTTMRDRVEALVADEEARCRARIGPYRARLAGKRAVLFTGGVKTWSMVNALRELGVEVLAAGTQNSTLEDFHRMKSLMHQDARIIEDTSTAGLLAVMREKMPDLMVAGGKTKFLALKTRTPFLDINHGRSHPYAGYEGMVTFARQLDLTVNSPIFPAMNARAPWELPAGEREARRAGGRRPRRRASWPRTCRLAGEGPGQGRHRQPPEELAGAGGHARLPGRGPDARPPARRAGLLDLHPAPALPPLQGVGGAQLDRHERGHRHLRRLEEPQGRRGPGDREVPARGGRRHDLRASPRPWATTSGAPSRSSGPSAPTSTATPVVWASTPDYCGSLQEGYAAAVEALLETLAEGGPTIPARSTCSPAPTSPRPTSRS